MKKNRRFFGMLLIAILLLTAFPVNAFAAGSYGSQFLELDCYSLTLKVGQSYTFDVTGQTNDGLAYTDHDPSYLLESNDDYFTFTALKPGSTVIEFRSTDDAVCVSCDVTILPNSESSTTPAPRVDDDTLVATINGEELVFQLNRTIIENNNPMITAVYYTYNPRGEARYVITLYFNKQFTEGTYEFGATNTSTDVRAVLWRAADNVYFTSYLKRPDRTKSAGTFTIEEMSSDWMTYTGSFDVTVTDYENKCGSVELTGVQFNFTLQD